MNDAQRVIAQSRAWVESVVVKHNFCPFARREVENEALRYQVVAEVTPDACLSVLLAECLLLDREPDIETTLVIYPRGFERFEDFLELVDIANALLSEKGYEGVYQLASFHPDYQFSGAPQEDPANYTNRSPHPMLHLIREASMEQALRGVDHPEQIPERNIALARALGRGALQSQLDACRKAR